MNEAGFGARVLNFLVDTFIAFLASYGLYRWWGFYVIYWNYPYFQYYRFFFGTLVVYYFLFELIFLRTPGKWLTMTKVKNIQGRRPAWYAILFRSVLRLTLIDPFFIGFINRPLHDALSNTRVVEA